MTTWKASRLRWSTKALASLSHQKTPLLLERRFFIRSIWRILTSRRTLFWKAGGCVLQEAGQLFSGLSALNRNAAIGDIGWNTADAHLLEQSFFLPDIVYVGVGRKKLGNNARIQIDLPGDVDQHISFTDVAAVGEIGLEQGFLCEGTFLLALSPANQPVCVDPWRRALRGSPSAARRRPRRALSFEPGGALRRSAL